MKCKQTIILMAVLVLILAAPQAFASWEITNGGQCTYGSNCTTARFVVNSTTLEPSATAECRLLLFRNFTLTVNTTMTLLPTTGLYYYDKAYNITGDYWGTMRCTEIDGTLSIVDVSFEVVEDNMNWQLPVVITTFGLAAIFLVIAWYFGKKKENGILKIILKYFSIIFALIMVLVALNAIRLILLDAFNQTASTAITGIKDVFGAVYVGALWFFIFFIIMLFTILIIDVVAMLGKAKAMQRFTYMSGSDEEDGGEYDDEGDDE